MLYNYMAPYVSFLYLGTLSLTNKGKGQERNPDHIGVAGSVTIDQPDLKFLFCPKQAPDRESIITFKSNVALHYINAFLASIF